MSCSRSTGPRAPDVVPAGLIILSDRESIGRLRRDSGCRRLGADSEVEFVSVDEIPGADASVPFEDRQVWAARLGAALGPDAPPVVTVWRDGVPGSGHSPSAMLERLRTFIERNLQADRALLRPAAVVAVFPGGISPQAAESLGSLSSSHAVYLMNSHTRLLADGPAWRAEDVWPVAVGRLLGSLRASPRRQTGLRAWRALAVLGADGEDDSLEAAASKLARQVISGVDDERVVDPLRSSSPPADSAHPLEPPDDRVSVDRVPQFAADLGGNPSQRRPELPPWWELAPVEGGMPTRGSARFESDGRLDLRPGSRWRAAFARRGVLFVRERFARARAAALSILGPGSVHARAWERIHRHPAFVPWHATGAFFRRPGGRSIEAIASQRLAWSRLREADDRAAAAAVRARATAHELDEARSCSPSLLVRSLCLMAATLFASSVVGVVIVSAGRTRGLAELQWSVITGLAACAGGLAAAGVLLYMEWRTGQSGRNVVESNIRQAETAIADAFHARMTLGAEGELLQRRTAWLQSAARVRETADRLQVVMGIQERAYLREEGNRGSPGAQSTACLEFRRAMSASLVPPVTGEAVVMSLRSRDPDLIARERDDFLGWWRECLRNLDPAFGGGIVASAFSAAYARRLSAISDKLRAELRRELEAMPDAAWSGFEGTGVRHAFGASDDVPGLSCVTHRARGMERHRVVFVHAPTEGAARSVGEGLARALHGDCSPFLMRTDTDGWGGLVMVVDELSVSLAASERGVDGGVLVLEGRSRERERERNAGSREVATGD